MIEIIRVPLKKFYWQIRLTIFLICLLKIQRRAFSLFWISLIDDERPPSHLIQICLNPISASEISLNLKSKFRINPVKAESRRTFKNLSIPKAQAPQLPKKFKLLKVALERKALVVNPVLGFKTRVLKFLDTDEIIFDKMAFFWPKCETILSILINFAVDWLLNGCWSAWTCYDWSKYPTLTTYLICNIGHIN